MKKIVLLISAIVLSLVSFAQFSFGIQGTGNLSSASFQTPGDLDLRKKMKAMPGGGLVVQYAFNKKIAVRSGVNYLKSGVNLKGTLEQEILKVELENNLDYVQVPLSVLYTIPVSRVQFFAGVGGFINYGISGKLKSTLTHTLPDNHVVVTVEEKDAFKKDEDGETGLKRADFGVAALGGIRLANGFFVNAGYQLSLSNISNDDGFSYKNRGLQLTIGRFF